MQRTGNSKWIYTKGGDLAGIALGYDYCAEHEWGADRMRSAFGCHVQRDGIERRLIRQQPPGLRLVSGTIKALPFDAIFLRHPHARQPAEKGGWIEEMLPHGYGDPESLVCAWDESTFGIVAYGKKDRRNVLKLWDAFQQQDVAVWANVGIFHDASGLCFCIPSVLPAVDKKTILESDLDRRRLLAASEATGIERTLRAAGKSWFALSPRWTKQSRNTKFEVIYWLNPADQAAYEYGWFTVEDLELWAKDQGPVMKKDHASE